MTKLPFFLTINEIYLSLNSRVSLFPAFKFFGNRKSFWEFPGIPKNVGKSRKSGSKIHQNRLINPKNFPGSRPKFPGNGKFEKKQRSVLLDAHTQERTQRRKKRMRFSKFPVPKSRKGNPSCESKISFKGEGTRGFKYAKKCRFVILRYLNNPGDHLLIKQHAFKWARVRINYRMNFNKNRFKEPVQ